MTTFDITAIGSRFCMYLRKSREDLLTEAVTNHDTLELHRTQLTDFARRLHAPILQVYEEIGSAESIDARPVFQELLEEVENGEWDGVFVIEIERLSRGSATDQGRVGEAFVESGTYIFTLQKIYDPANESDMDYFDFSLFMSRREYLTIRRRLLNGKLNHCRRGEYIGLKPPYGYEKVKIDGMKTLKPLAAEERYVKLMFEWYADGDSMRQIAARLTEMAVPTPNPDSARKNVWSACTIQKLLNNPIYIGKVRWQNRISKTEKINGKKVRKTVRNENPHLFPGLHPAIVSEELFERVQKRLAVNAPYPRSREPRNHYAGLINCAECGTPLILHNSKGNRQTSLVHRSWDRGVGCNMKSCLLKNVDDAIIEWLTETIADIELEIKDSDTDKQTSLYEAEKARLEAEIAKANKIIAENIERLEEGIYTKEQFLERQAVHNTRIERAKQALATLEPPSAEANLNRVTTLHQTIEALRDPDFDVRAKNDLLKSVIASIKYTNRSPRGTDSGMVLEIKPR